MTPKPTPFNRAAVLANFRGIFADPRAKVCFTSVFFEAIFVHGLFPYVALLLLAIGEPSASIAGLLIAAFAVGRRCLLASSVPVLVARVPERAADGDRRRLGRDRRSSSIALHFSWVRRSPSIACSASASTCCIAASRCT